eukprot:1486611-Rhodomonas_salina.4
MIDTFARGVVVLEPGTIAGFAGEPRAFDTQHAPAVVPGWTLALVETCGVCSACRPQLWGRAPLGAWDTGSQCMMVLASSCGLVVELGGHRFDWPLAQYEFAGQSAHSVSWWPSHDVICTFPGGQLAQALQTNCAVVVHSDTITCPSSHSSLHKAHCASDVIVHGELVN